MTQVVAVADSAGRQTRFAASLSSAFSAAGVDLLPRTHRELTAEVSIEQPPERGPIVDPDRPLLWLCPGGADQPGTADGRFLAWEALAAARSIATLTRSPVLNRPSAVGLCGTLPPGPAVAVRRARHHDREATVRAERFTGGWLPDDGGDPGELEVHDYATGRRSYGPDPSSSGPFRRRAAVHRADLVKVRVVGDRTITTTGVAPPTLAASLRLASWYQLDMATFWWLVGRDDGMRTLARIDCWEWDAGLDASVDEVARAVVAWLAGRLERPAEGRR